MNRLQIAFAGLYFAIAIATFGYAATNAVTCYAPADQPSHPCTPGEAGLAGLGAALFWPLYWSWELQQ